MTAMGMRSDLVTFNAARLDDVEAAAAAASDGPWTAWRGKPGLGLAQLEYAVALPGQDSGSFAAIATASWMDAEHIAIHDPARVLRMATSLRHVLFACNKLPDQTALYILLSLAVIWQDHADYRQEWAADS